MKSRTETLLEIISYSSDYTTDEIELTATSESLGMDSLDRIEFIMSLEEVFDMELSDDESESLRNLTVQQMLDKLAEWLGPEFPENGVLTLNDDQFIRRYHPERDNQGNYFRQRDWCDDGDELVINANKDTGHLWTAMDDDYGRFCFVNGWHYVNRIYYIITKKPVEDQNWHVQVYDPNEEIETEEADEA